MSSLSSALSLPASVTTNLFVAYELVDPTNDTHGWAARIHNTREEAEFHSPYVLTFDEYMATPDSPPLIF
jgi:hypothetical protein